MSSALLALLLRRRRVELASALPPDEALRRIEALLAGGGPAGRPRGRVRGASVRLHLRRIRPAGDAFYEGSRTPTLRGRVVPRGEGCALEGAWTLPGAAAAALFGAPVLLLWSALVVGAWIDVGPRAAVAFAALPALVLAGPLLVAELRARRALRHAQALLRALRAALGPAPDDAAR